MRRLLVLLVCAAALALPATAAAFGQLGSIGAYGTGAGQMSSPQGIGFAADGAMYVADSDNDRIAVFSPSGVFLRAFGDDVGPGGADVCTTSCQASDGEAGLAGQMYRPYDVAVDGDRVYVADRNQTRIAVFNTAGAFLFAFGKDVGPAGADKCTTTCFPGAGTDDAAGAVFPIGIAVDEGQVFAANEEYDRIDVFSTEGAFLYSFGKEVNSTNDSDVCSAASGCKEGEENGPEALGQPQDIAFGADGRIYVADGQNERVDVWTRAGAFVSTFAAGQLVAPVSISTAASTVYVADAGSDRVETFSYAGVKLGGFAATPDVAAVASPCGGNVFVSEGDSGSQFARVARFGEPGTLLPPCPSATTISAPVVVPPSNKVTFGKLKRNRGKGTAILVVKLPGPGRLVLKGRGLFKSTKNAQRAGNFKLKVRAKGRVKKKLNRTGKATATARIVFSPTGGTPRAVSRSLTLKKTLR